MPDFISSIASTTPVISGIIAVVIILGVGFMLYCLWEVGLRFIGHFGKGAIIFVKTRIAPSLVNMQETTRTVDTSVELDKA